MNPKISVIIPVYKVEPYIRQCLNSVVNQTYQNLEIIIVDDGSPDRCGAICDEYAQKDSRIQVIHKKNGGLSAARNDALKKVTGEWISFVDSDDWCELDLYEKAIAVAVKNQADIAMFSLFRNKDSKEERISAFDREFVSEDREFLLNLQLSALNYRYTPYCSAQNWYQGFPWDKLFRASFILENGLHFAENVQANEDVIFNICAFQYAQKVVFFDEALYHWRINPESIGHKYTEQRVNVDREIYAEIGRIGDQYNLPDKFYRALDVRIVTNTIALGQRCLFHKKRKGSIIEKIRYATKVLHSEPFYSAYNDVDRRKLGKIGKVVTLGHSGCLLYVAVVIIKCFHLE